MTFKQFLVSITDAIREKEGSTDDIKVTDFPERIRNIPTGTDEMTKTEYIKLFVHEIVGGEME